MFKKFKIETAEPTIKEFIQNDYASLWSNNFRGSQNKSKDDCVYFDPNEYPEMAPGLHMIKKSIPTKAQTLNEFLEVARLGRDSILDTNIIKISNFNTNIIGNYALVLFDLVAGLKLANTKTIRVKTVVAQTLILTNKGWRVVNEDVF